MFSPFQKTPFFFFKRSFLNKINCHFLEINNPQSKKKIFMYNFCLNLKSFNLDSLIRTENFLFFIFSFLKIKQIKQKMNPKKCKKITVLRSPHIDKKSREQFQIITHKRTLVFSLPNKTILLLFLEFLKTSKFPGVELDILIEFPTF